MVFRFRERSAVFPSLSVNFHLTERVPDAAVEYPYIPYANVIDESTVSEFDVCPQC
jgi:hypothetical protein